MRSTVFRKGPRATALAVIARMGLLHDFCLQRGVVYPTDAAYLVAPIEVTMATPGRIERLEIRGRVAP